MIKTLMKSIKGYGVPSLLSIVFVSFEVIMEVSISFVMKYLKNNNLFCNFGSNVNF